MTKETMKKRIEKWLDAQITADKNKAIVIGDIQLNNLALCYGKAIHVMDIKPIAECLGKECTDVYKFKDNGQLWYIETSIIYKGYHVFSCEFGR